MQTKLGNFGIVLTLGLAVATAGVVGCSSSSPSRTAEQYQHNQQLANNVKIALDNSQSYKYSDVTINTYEGTVQLSGYVASDDQKAEAARIASGVPGVSHVKNDLLIKSNPAVGGATTPGGTSTGP